MCQSKVEVLPWMGQVHKKDKMTLPLFYFWLLRRKDSLNLLSF